LTVYQSHRPLIDTKVNYLGNQIHPLTFAVKEQTWLPTLLLFIADSLCRLVGGRNVQINEQINRTKAKSQQIVVQDYSHAYNTLFFI